MIVNGIDIGDGSDFAAIWMRDGSIVLRKVEVVSRRSGSQPLEATIGVGDGTYEVELFYRHSDEKGDSLDEFYCAGLNSLRDRWTKLGGTREDFDRKYRELFG